MTGESWLQTRLGITALDASGPRCHGVMPKRMGTQTSVGNKARRITRQPSASFSEPRHGLSVGWNKVGWAQIHMFPHEWESTGDWIIVDLDRAAINRLIRSLRKARDAAYGSDA